MIVNQPDNFKIKYYSRKKINIAAFNVWAIQYFVCMLNWFQIVVIEVGHMKLYQCDCWFFSTGLGY